MHLEINLFGSFSVRFAGQPITTFRSAKVRGLLAYLALHPDELHQRKVIAAWLWPEAADKQARQSLRSALYFLRQSLSPVSDAISDAKSEPSPDALLLTVTPQTIQLNTHTQTLIVVDVNHFQELLTTCETHQHTGEEHAGGGKHTGGEQAEVQHCLPCLDRLAEAADLYKGELLAGFGLDDAPEFEEWLLLQREMWHHRALIAFKTLADAYEARNEYEQAHTFARRLLHLDPYRETAHRQLMRLLAYRGLPDQAVAQYATCRQLLKDEFGAEPEAETVTLVEQIRRGEFEDAVRFGESAVTRWQGD